VDAYLPLPAAFCFCVKFKYEIQINPATVNLVITVLSLNEDNGPVNPVKGQNIPVDCPLVDEAQLARNLYVFDPIDFPLHP